MDGTLLNDDHIISNQTAEAIKKLQAHGIEFVIATGRTFHSAKILLDHHKIDCDMINLNGAAIYNRQGKLLESIAIENHIVHDIITYCQNSNLEYSIMTGEHFYVHNRQAFIERIQKYLTGKNLPASDNETTTDAQFLNELAKVKDTSEFQFQTNDKVLKIMTMSDKQKPLQHFKHLFEKNNKLDITSSSPDNLEITNLNAQKGFAVQKYANNKGITMDEVLCIGDSLNDRSMILMAKYGYVMENAIEEVKKLSPLRAPHHAQEGVSQIIQEVIKGNI